MVDAQVNEQIFVEDTHEWVVRDMSATYNNNSTNTLIGKEHILTNCKVIIISQKLQFYIIHLSRTPKGN